ncbi:MAG TPA: hypothetical protein VN872_07305 [Candidatus Acidoferrum sp.]|nr:hypothetical protein [Candidatus Acidoferrum sp.]
MFYPGETVRLLCAQPENALPQFIEGTVAAVLPPPAEDAPRAVEVRFYRNGAAVTVSLPFDDVELVIEQSLLFRTAVFWALEGPRNKLVEAAINSVLDSGFLMRDGLNVARLYYDRDDRWWKWGEKMTDSTGALVVTSAPTWDGCVVAFSGRQRFHLEFRLQGRGDAVIFLHEREVAYSEQATATESAMSLARVLMNLSDAAGARYCAFPVADPWLQDEDWVSLLRAPLYPDFFMLPETEGGDGISEPFRTIRLTENRVVKTTLPMKASPMETAFHRSDQELNLDRLRKLKALGEKYYDQMYESGRGANRCYSSAKDAFYDAISLASELGMKEEEEALSKRLEHIKAVFRSQFS